MISPKMKRIWLSPLRLRGNEADRRRSGRHCGAAGGGRPHGRHEIITGA